ncbi:fibronectin-binding protein (FBP) [Leptospira yanagawae]|uniref:Fibronectin-binding protein (FBP) n=1 Tax=Leptospira yanagawae TaxID=293069 RepID=A0ABY2M7F7_9LEPT|nr:SIR2 family protein [Leptospira yanagawae]TGL23018.1 fibronectin-binding protein (FBP) [Leptospira yanagawae]
MNIDWSKKNILKIRAEVLYLEETDLSDSHKIQLKLEPWLTAIFQTEHLSLLLGSGFSTGIGYLAKIKSQGMSRISFNNYKKEISDESERSAKEKERINPNLEDDFRVSLELLRGLEILKHNETIKLREEISNHIKDFCKSIVLTEREFVKSPEYEKVKSILTSFLVSFGSRTATRERLHIFTTNYDRFIEYGADQAGLILLDSFSGTIEPTFRSTKLELDYHYNPPGIRGEPRYVEGVARLTKLHGSVDWRQKEKEIIRTLLPFGANANHPDLENDNQFEVIIYPNSDKGIDTAYYPYSELFRDFSSAICRPNASLVTYGYGFGDSHINRIIRDMLRIPSTHLAIISFDTADGKIENFYKTVNEDQITLVIGNQLASIDQLTEHYLPKAAIDRITEKMMRNLEKRRNPADSNKPGSDFDAKFGTE